MANKVGGVKKGNAVDKTYNKAGKKANKADKKDDELFPPKADKADKKGPNKKSMDAASSKADSLKEKATKNGSNIKANSVKVDGNKVTYRTKDGKKIEQKFNDNGGLKLKTVKNGDKVTTTRYKPDGSKRHKITEQGGRKVTRSYEKDVITSKTIEQDGKKITIHYSADGKKRTNKTIEQDGMTTKIDYSADGKTKKSKNTQGEIEGQHYSINTIYDKNGKATSKTTQVLGEDGKFQDFKKEEFVRNEDGTVQSKTTTKGDTTTTRTYTYDGKKRTCSIHSENSKTGVVRDYDEKQDLDDNGRVIKTVRTDELGNVVRETNKTYDDNGKLSEYEIKKTNGAGETTVETRKNYTHKADGSKTYQVTFKDAKGNVTKSNEQRTQYANGQIAGANDQAAGANGQAEGANAQAAGANDQAAGVNGVNPINNEVPIGNAPAENGQNQIRQHAGHNMTDKAYNTVMNVINGYVNSAFDFLKNFFNSIGESLGLSQNDIEAGDALIEEYCNNIDNQNKQDYANTQDDGIVNFGEAHNEERLDGDLDEGGYIV